MAAKTSKAISVSTPKSIDSNDDRIFKILQQTLYVDFDSYTVEDKTINKKMRTTISCNLFTYTGQLVLLNIILFCANENKKADLLYEIFKTP